jgi:hypothetical protein
MRAHYRKIATSTGSERARPKVLRRGELPILLEDYAGAEDLLAPFHARYSSARAHGREPEQAPAADAAWIAELEKALFDEEVAD